MIKITLEQVNALLPQTQCRDCGYTGCRPYAAAIIDQHEALDRCLPGSVKTLQALGNLLQKDITALVPAMEKKTKPAVVASIREVDCIGCTKCIQACPVDAIIGSAKWMHTVIAQECTGCGLCVPPCPVDCIDLLPVSAQIQAERLTQADYFRHRYEQREQRLQKRRNETKAKHDEAKKTFTALSSKEQIASARRSYIQQAIQRVKEKKTNISHTGSSHDQSQKSH